MPFPTTTPSSDTLLVVDDSTVQREYAVSMFRKLGAVSIYEARSGAEALELLSMLVLPPSLMVIDLEMPLMDGVELMEAMAQCGVDIPLVIASSRDQVLIDSVVAMGTALGLNMVAGLQKPLKQEELSSALHARAGGTSVHRGSGVGSAPAVNAHMLREALANGELVAHYQPKLHIRSGLVQGVEALARWHHPEFGPIPPDQFIPVAERDGLIAEVTYTISAQAFAQASQWNKSGHRLSMAVNLSPRMLERPDVAARIGELAEHYAVPSGQVVLEITESSLLTQLGTALSVLARLRLKGFGLSIDDYGTGFSSMQQLARIPFTELKIDRSFVHGAHQRKNLRVILKSALQMARQLGLDSVAEGVETLDDWRLLQELGCDIGQGWLIAKPMAGSGMADWMRAYRAQRPNLRALPRAQLPALDLIETRHRQV